MKTLPLSYIEPVLEELSKSWQDDRELEAIGEWETCMEFGQETGECGTCGSSLDKYEMEHGLCESCLIEFDELTGVEHG